MRGPFNLAPMAVFTFLSAPPNERTLLIGEYLLSNLSDHLGVLLGATGVDSIGRTDSQEIENSIYALFHDVDIIERHFVSCESVDWHRSVQQSSIFLNWFQDETAISHLSKRDREWLSYIKKGGNPKSKFAHSSNDYDRPILAPRPRIGSWRHF